MDDVDSAAILLPERRPGASVVVYGISHAGAGAAPWNSVAAKAPPALEIRGIRLPGREKRLHVPAHTSVPAAAAEVAAIMSADATNHQGPVMVVGSCSGALVGHAAVAALSSRLRVSALVVLRQPPPRSLPIENRCFAGMDSTSLRAWLRHARLTPTALLDDSDLFEFFEPLLRTDLAMTDGYVYQGPAVECPIVLVSWAADQPQPWYVDGWRTETKARLHMVTVDGVGSGDLLTEAPHALATALSRAWQDVIGRDH